MCIRDSHYFISLYNKLEEKCGVVFLSTDYIVKRISNGLKYQKPGYKASKCRGL